MAPFLEEDLAFCSIAQDELGHAASLYAIVAGDGDPAGDAVNDRAIDDLAFHREPGDWRSAQFVEVASTDWAHALARHWLYDAAEELRWALVADSTLTPLAHAAQRACREESFHLRHADGLLDLLLPVPDSGDRIRAAVVDLLRCPRFVRPRGRRGRGCGRRRGHSAVRHPPSRMDRTGPGTVRHRPGDRRQAWAQREDRTESRLRPLLERMREVFALDPSAIW